jgi:hypothetical protein
MRHIDHAFSMYNYFMSWMDRFTALKEIKPQSDDAWAGAPNEWIKHLSATAKGRLAVQAYVGAFGGKACPGNSSGYDIDHSSYKIEAKLSTRSYSGTNGFVWLQVRPRDPYTHLWLVAVEPTAIRTFLLPREAATPRLLKHHGRETGGNTFQIKTTSGIAFPQWLVEYERSAP